ncbi:MAG: type II secretion system protein J [Candidatus Omnitrophota bacterium]
MRPNGSFTLIEMLVVMTLFSIVGVGITSSFVSGMKVWHRAKIMGPENVDILLFMEIAARDLRKSLDISEIGFEGEEDEIHFPCLDKGSLVKMSYGFDASSGVIWRKTEKFGDIVGGDTDNGDNYIRDDILPADGLSWSYFYFDENKGEYLWKDSWGREEGVFGGIRLRVKVGNNEFAKTVFVPYVYQ